MMTVGTLLTLFLMMTVGTLIIFMMTVGILIVFMMTVGTLIVFDDDSRHIILRFCY